MKKRGMFLVILLLTLAILPVVLATEESQVLNAYSCLENKIDNLGCSSLSFEEKTFSLMSVQKCQSEVQNSSAPAGCFPSSNCKIKDTAQAVLALEDVNVNTTSAQNWLLSQKATPKELDWFLEIETSSPAKCILTYQGGNHQISIDENKKISGTTGSCLNFAQNNYWLKISPACFNQEIQVSCDSSTFLTTLLFKKQDSSTIHVSEDTHSSAKDGLTSEIVDALCFGKGETCDYEGSLWATLVLYSQRKDISKYLPYLITLEPENQKFIPQSFLYFITGQYKNSLLSKQKLSKYWEESGDRYYDTALAAWPFYYDEPTQWRNSRDWLLGVQGTDGCWDSGNLRNTAFILKSFWPKYFEPPVPPECTNATVEQDCGTGKICVEGMCENPVIVCGNNIKEAGELCDGTDLNGKSCSDINSIFEGTLSCDTSCHFNTSLCTEIPECTNNDDCSGDEICQNGACIDPNNPPTEPVCGNNIKEGYYEQCDGTDLNGYTCADFEAEGTLSCDSECNFDSSECTEISECTNNDDCLGIEICNENGFCVIPGDGTNTCDTSYNCKSNQECVENKCVDNEFLDCEDTGYYCLSESSCDGNIVDSYSQSCNSPFKCCSEPLPLETCEAQDSNGEICGSNEVCQGGLEVGASGLLSFQTCCINGGECVEDNGGNEGLACSSNGGFCRFNCESGEEESLSYTCDYGEICCLEKTNPGKKSSWFIWVLLILIVLATVGIIFRDKLKPFFLKLKTKFKKKPKPKSGIPVNRLGTRRPFFKRLFKPKSQSHPSPQRSLPPPRPNGLNHKRPNIEFRRPGIKPKAKDNGELDEVLKKLRDIGK